jgi:hypothetical protein
VDRHERLWWFHLHAGDDDESRNALGGLSPGLGIPARTSSRQRVSILRYPGRTGGTSGEIMGIRQYACIRTLIAEIVRQTLDNDLSVIARERKALP